MKHLFILTTIAVLGLCSCSHAPVSNEAVWNEKASGVWEVTVGKPEKLNLLSELTIKPKLNTINEMEKADLPVDKNEIRFELVDGKTYIRFPLEKDEKIFGLGLNFKTVEQRGRIMQLHTDHYGGTDNGRTHAPVPFFVSSKGYGAFINSARYIDVYAGIGVRKDTKNPPEVQDRNTDPAWSAQPYSDNLEFLVPVEGVEIILFSGNTMLDVVRRFNLYNGGGTLPPKWGLGFWHRVPTLFSDEDVKAEVAEFEKRNFPLTVIGLEPGWMSKAYPCTYEWDKSRFPDPKAFVDEMKTKNIQTNLWINPGVSPASEIAAKIEPLTASHTEWNGLVPDYTMPEAQRIMRDHFKKHQLDLGVSGYKMDENDGFDCWLWPDVATFPSGNSAEQMRQIYGSLMQDLTTNMYREKNERTYGLVRAGNGGTSSYPYVLYNDYYNHRDFITALINSSFIGVLWTPEVRASKTSEEWLRRMQTVCFSPLAMLNAWADGTKPWSFQDVEKQVNEISILRMQLIPYLYTAFADYAFYGTPPMRAMNLEAGYTADATLEAGKLDATDNPYAMAMRREVKDQFMAGDNLLIAPLFAGETARKVVLPQGKWYDFYTGELVGESEVITAAPGLDKIPVYVKDGGIVPLWPAITKLDGTKLPLEVRHYGSKPGTFNLYDDDGETFNYENGEFVRIQLAVTVDANGNKATSATVPEGKQPWSYNGEYNFRFMTK